MHGAWFDMLTMRCNTLISQNLILSVSKDEADIISFQQSAIEPRRLFLPLAALLSGAVFFFGRVANLHLAFAIDGHERAKIGV
jgi:hypothetical protein